MATEANLTAIAFEYGWVAVVGLVGIIYKANIKRIDEISTTASEALTRVEFEDYAKRTLCARKEMRDSVKELHDGQLRLFEALARIEGKMEK